MADDFLRKIQGVIGHEMILCAIGKISAQGSLFRPVFFELGGKRILCESMLIVPRKSISIFDFPKESSVHKSDSNGV